MRSQKLSLEGQTLTDFARRAALLAMALGLLVLCGWAFKVPALIQLRPTFPHVVPNTALGFLLSGLGLWLLARPEDDRGVRRLVGRLAAAAPLLLGLLTLAEYAFDWNPGLDELLLRGLGGAAGVPGRPSPQTALNLALVGLALLTLDVMPRRWPRPASLLAVIVAAISLFALIGYLYDVPLVYGEAGWTGMALLTVLGFLALSAGLFCARPAAETTGLVTGAGPGSQVVRKLMRAAIALPLLFGWMRLAGQRAGLFEIETSEALLAISNILLSGALIWWIARSLERADVERRRAEEALQRAHDELERRVRERTEDLRRANEALQESARHYRMLFEQNPNPMWVFDRETLAFLAVNHSAVAQYGYSEQEFLRMTIRDIRPPEDVPALLTNLASPDKRIEWCHRRKDGQLIQVDVQSNDIEFQNRPARLVLATDITERKRAERIRRRLMERLQVLHEIDQAVLAATSARDIARNSLRHIRRLIPCRRASLTLFDFEAGVGTVLAIDVDGETRFGPQARVPLDEEFGDLEQLRQGRVHRVDDLGEVADPPPVLRAFIEEGLRAYVNVPLAADGQLIGALNLWAAEPNAFEEDHLEIGREVADQLAIALHNARLREQIERHAAELEDRVRERTEQLEFANRELEAFSYSVSHDLRAPLRHIDGFVQLLARREQGRLDATSARYLRVVSDATARMGKLIDELLAFSRTGRRELQTCRVDMRPIIEEARREADGEAAGRRIEWHIGELPEVEADPGLMRIVWINLLSNAVKYTATRAAARIEVGARADGRGELVFFVRDNGVGFDMQYAHKLFGVFQRLHREEEFAGIGIGLATVRRIIHRHGGRVWAEGAPGEGAAFFFTLKEGKADDDGDETDLAG